MRIWRDSVLLVGIGLLGATLLVVFGTAIGGIPPVGTLLDPVDGLYRTARFSVPAGPTVHAAGVFDDTVRVLRDERGVPHIFAQSDRDAVRALGYVTAQDRLFQVDFLTRAAAGRLSEVLGDATVESDRFLRRTGMLMGARRNVVRIEKEAGLEWEILQWYAQGFNAWLDTTTQRDAPFEFRLLGYEPQRFTPLHAMLILQYMAYDLTYHTDAADYARLRRRLPERAYERFYPRHDDFSIPIIPPGSRDSSVTAPGGTPAGETAGAPRTPTGVNGFRDSIAGTVIEGFRHGKGSNNWAVDGTRSATGAPMLAGDMHLGLSLPSIWYEAHLVTPTMNLYGVTIPGAPVVIEGFNDHVAWAFTNTSADQIDHYAVQIDASGRRYRYEGQWLPLTTVVDPIAVKGAAPVTDTVRHTRWGPLLQDNNDSTAISIRWTAHEPSTTLLALWNMNRASDLASFDEALRDWDTPMQNILYAGADGHVAIRSTGHLPIRRGGHGVGLLDGSTDTFDWIGRVPFDELPHAVDPEQGFLTSTNQQPTDSSYRHYLGHDWRAVFRSIRIDELLRGQVRHGIADFQRYQSDVHVVQHDWLRPMLAELDVLPDTVATVRDVIVGWDGDATTDALGPLPFALFLDALERKAWDEPAFIGVRRPALQHLIRLLAEDPKSPWIDIQATELAEDGPALMKAALADVAVELDETYGADPSDWRWGDHHGVLFPHLLASDRMRALGRGPLTYPGFASTLSPARGLTATHSASWRMIVDFSYRPPRGVGIYPGGQSGNPFSPLYDLHVPAYTEFEYYELMRPRTPAELPADRTLSTSTLVPVGR